jgi:hypothetical protein
MSKARSTRVSRPDAGQMLAEMLEMLAQMLGQMLAECLRCWGTMLAWQMLLAEWCSA